MYAVIASGGKQYRVEEGQVLNLETLDDEVGKSVSFNNMLMIVDGEKVNVGKPYIDGAKVAAEVVEHGRAKKINILKFKRRKQHMKRQGHRQNFTQVKITSIGGSAKKAAPKEAAAPKKAAPKKADKAESEE